MICGSNNSAFSSVKLTFLFKNLSWPENVHYSFCVHIFYLFMYLGAKVEPRDTYMLIILTSVVLVFSIVYI